MALLKDKRLWAAALILALLLVMAAVDQSRLAYPIDPDCANLDAAVAAFYDWGDQPPRDVPVRLYDSVDIGRSRYVLCELGPELELGTVELKRSLTGRYKIDHLSWGGGNFRFGTAEADGRTYLLAGGRNTACRIGSLVFDIEGQTCTLTLPASERFLVSAPLEAQPETRWPDISKVRVYDAQGLDITEQVDLSGGGI